MKIYTSYFYQLRFFTPNMVPISTAKWQPKWYGYTPYIDKRGVMNGLRAESFVLPEDYWKNLVNEGAECSPDCPHIGPCKFMDYYYEYLNTLDFNNILSRLEGLAQRVCDSMGIQEEPIIVLMVHEPKSCNCAERPVIQRWFREHGIDISEWDKNLIF